MFTVFCLLRLKTFSFIWYRYCALLPVMKSRETLRVLQADGDCLVIQLNQERSGWLVTMEPHCSG